MKTVFIVNPKAGKKKDVDGFIAKINDAARKIEEDTEVYLTKSVGDATVFVKEYCQKYGPARFIACGGDGTLNEVVNGAIEHPGSQIGVMPMGTGNDFCRNFAGDTDFSSVLLQITSDVEKCDAIMYTTELNGNKKSGYCINMFNIGFDCNVADLTGEMKQKPFISGSFAYFISIFITLIKKKGAELKIEIDGEERHNGKLLLTSIANGSYCGGGIKSNPIAEVNDGYMSVNIIKNISRGKFLTLLPKYMNGTFLGIKNIEKVVSSLKCQNIVITPYNKSMKMSVDGEINNVNKTEFKIIRNALDFVIPTTEKKTQGTKSEKTIYR